MYWGWIDTLPTVVAACAGGERPLLLRLTHAASGQTWDVRLLQTDDGMQMQVGRGGWACNLHFQCCRLLLSNTAWR